ncbi:MAG: hypothetical protein H0X69_17280 [Gemmatimonadales bacterium]|nr:hypothetical protein [Gemmatimonadales bacterium]
MRKPGRLAIAALGLCVGLLAADLWGARMRLGTWDTCVWMAEAADARLGLDGGDVLGAVDSLEVEIGTGEAWARWARWEQIVRDHASPGACLGAWARVRAVGVPPLRTAGRG